MIELRTKSKLFEDGTYVVATDRNIRKIFGITGLDRVLTIHNSSPGVMNGGLHVA